MINQSTFGRRGPGSNEQRVFRTQIAEPVEVIITRRGPGRWKIVAYVVGGLFVLGTIGNLAEPEAARRGATDVAEAAPANVEASKCRATLKEFTALQIGISPGRAGAIIGCKGEELSRVSFGGKESVMPTWPGEAGLFSNMNATFNDGRLVAKAQLGLNDRQFAQRPNGD
jgi:hypothetical protein